MSLMFEGPISFPSKSSSSNTCRLEREFFIDNLLVRIHLIIEMIWRTGLAPWEFEFPFPGSLISTLLAFTFGLALVKGSRVRVGGLGCRV